MKKRLPFPKWILLLLIVLGLSFLGTLFVFEASTAESFSTFGSQYHFLHQHLIGLGLGTLALIIGFCVPPKLWITFGPLLYAGGILLLLLTLLPGIGLDLNGAQRWISLGGIRFQSVEFLKFGLIAYFAAWMQKHQKIGPFLFLTAIPALLIILQPDLGSLLLIGAIAISMFFLAGGSIKHFLLLGAVALPLVLVAIVTSPYRMERLTTFLNPESDPLGASFHIRQITLALGRGGLWGQGIGNSHQKYSYIPEASTDSIFAIIAEEVGFVGAVAIITSLLFFLYTGYRSIQQADISDSERLLGMGILFWIGLQILLNLSAVVALIPLTGMPLPFFSYGRSAQVMILFASGIVIRLGRKVAA
ncbi:MAG: cell division protein FtsW [Pseudomonadales bacterium]|nr:cell division protein FtsW [Candidatus Woesebacteria bacterium]MCB9800763.1 cell division protein FtsW [Pseudomonadales bacterium]